MPINKIFPENNSKYQDRKIEVGQCPVCEKLVIELTQYCIRTGKYELVRPKRRELAKFVKKFANQKWQADKIKYGTKERAGFVYGINKRYRNGKIYQYAVDFNGQKKLVKIINPKTAN